MPPVCGPSHTGGMSTSGDPILDAVRDLEDDFAEAMSRMYTVGNELARLRGRLAREAGPQEWTPVATPAPTPAGAVIPPPVTPPFAGQARPVDTPRPATPWWQRDGFVARLLAVVGAGITLIGVAFLLAMAIQLGFFGPLARVISGALLAAGLVATAVVVHRRTASTPAALGLAATGIAAGYLDVLAVTWIYAWVPAVVGLVVAGLIALGGLLLARSWDSQLLGTLAVLGVCLLAPFVGSEDVLLTGTFLLVLAVATWPAQVSRSWHLLELARIVPATIYLAALTTLDQPMVPVTLLASALAALVLVTSLAGTRIERLPHQIGLLVPVAALPLVMAATDADKAPGVGLLLALTGALVLVAVLARENEETPLHYWLVEPSLATAGVTSILAAAHSTTDTDATIPALLLVALIWSVAALVLEHRATLRVALFTVVPGLVGLLTLIPLMLYRSEAPAVSIEDLAGALLGIIALLVLARAFADLRALPIPRLPEALLAIALVWAGGAVILAGVLVGALADNREGGFTAGQTGATLLWLGTAAFLLVRGLRGSALAVPAGLVITALSVGKLIIFDLAFLDGIPRVLSFIVGGLIVLGMGAGYAQALERSRRDHPPVDNSTPQAPLPPTV